MLDAAALHRLLAALRQQLTTAPTEDRAVRAEIQAVSAWLDQVSGEPVVPESAAHDRGDALGVALDLADQSAPAVAAALRPIGEVLPWRYSYAPRADAPGLASAIGWAEIVGPLAPFRSDAVCLGLTLIAAGSFYPPHRHPAVELYHVLAGHPEWTAGPHTRIQAPGAFILHDSDMIHAMRADHEPLLAIYTWTGDVVSPSAWADEA
jgi:quercetin dioxygenase-like cupin family protein